jgi:tetratricopeptide (TPR) repeat protein
MIASVLPNDNFLDAAKTVENINKVAPDSAWGPVLAAKAAMERGDWAEAEKWTRNILDKKMEPAYLGLREEMTRFLMAERNYSYDEASRWMVDGLDNDSLARHSLDLATAYYQQAKQMKAEGNPAWEALAANGLALAEAGTPIHTEDGLHYQDGLLNLLGKDLAQKYLSEPFDQVKAEITQSIPKARAESLRAWELERSLQPSQRMEFNFLRQTQGTTAALKQFAQH